MAQTVIEEELNVVFDEKSVTEPGPIKPPEKLPDMIFKKPKLVEEKVFEPVKTSEKTSDVITFDIPTEIFVPIVKEDTMFVSS